MSLTFVHSLETTLNHDPCVEFIKRLQAQLPIAERAEVARRSLAGTRYPTLEL